MNDASAVHYETTRVSIHFARVGAAQILNRHTFFVLKNTLSVGHKKKRDVNLRQISFFNSRRLTMVVGRYDNG